MHRQSLHNVLILVWNFVKRKASIVPFNQAAPSEDDPVEHFNREFVAPNDNLERKFNLELNQALESHNCDLGFVVTAQKIRDAKLKMKKKHSFGADQLWGMHLVHGSPSLINHLELLYQMISNCEQVPDAICPGFITPACKKGKDSADCQSFRPITVSPVFCKLKKSIVINMLNETCSTPENQFCFKKSLSRQDVHTILTNFILETTTSEGPLFLAGHDVSRTFDSGIYPQLLLVTLFRGINSSVIATLRNMYRKLNVKVNSLSGKSSDLLDRSIPVHKGI